MRDRTGSRHEYDEVEENHDGRTMALLAAGAALVCGLFVTAGFATYRLVFHEESPGLVTGVDQSAEGAVTTQPRPVAVKEPPPVESVDDGVGNPTHSSTAHVATAVTPSQSELETSVDNPSPPEPAREPVLTEVAGPKVAAAVPVASVPEEAPVTPALGQKPKLEPEPPESTQVAAVLSAPSVVAKPVADQPGSVAKNSASGTPLIYQWHPGDIQGYSVSMATTVNGQKQNISGTVELTCDEQPPKTDSKTLKKTKPETGTGTGFVVSSDGHLVTCAHVIQGADKIDVQIGGKSYAAKVMSVEADDDLAILKINAANLSPLPLADSSKIRLGEEVRAIGFPLSTVLGDGIKVTKGIVAGIVDREDGKRIQIDAAVNPGNSGGPVVNDRGQVLGVASSKLVGRELTRVGFCVPAEQILSLLKAQNLDAVDVNPERTLDGPALVETVAPSVALVTVTISPQTVSGELVRIRTSGKFRTKRETNNRQRLIFALPNMTFNSGELNVDAYGNVASFSAPNQLPFLAGPMALLTVHQFDPRGRSSWTVRDQIKVTVQRDNSPFGRMRIPVPRPPRFGGRIRDPFAPETVKEFEAQEVHQYRIVSDSDDKVVLEKTFTLTTLDNDESPHFRISGKGEVVFSRKLGLVESFEFDHLYEKNDGKESVRIPVEIIVAREDSAVVAKRKREAAIAQAKVEHGNAMKAANKAVVPAGEQLDALLKKIKEENAKGGYPSSQLGSLSKFTVLPERQPEVEALLVDLLESKQYLTVRSSLDALTRWGSPNCVPAVIAQLKHSKFPVVQSAVKTLGTLGDEQAVAPLLETLRKNRLARHDAKGALAKLGEPVEEPVIALLYEKDLQVFHAACDILKEVGGEASVEPLESLANGKDFSRKSYAGRALSSVKSRVIAAQTAAAEGDSVVSDPSALRVDAVLKAMAAEPDKSGHARTSAIMKLGAPTDYKRDELEDALLKSLDDPNFAVQHQGMMALQKRATKRSIPRLLKLFTNLDSKLQYLATATLKKTGIGPEDEQQLTGMLASSDRRIQKSIIDLLTESGSPKSLSALDELANSPRATSIQYGAARAAARIRLRANLPISS